ncbi:MAG: class I SAM-dependent methyltransferase [Acidimicrobiales bacterium]
MSSVARRVAHQLLSRLPSGTVLLAEGGRTRRFGQTAPVVRVDVHDPRCFAAVLRRGSVGLAESYADGWWDCDDLTALIQILARAMAPWRQRLDHGARALAPVGAPWRHLDRRDLARDRANVRAHYDLSNEFFALMLDETMMYSCAVFEDPSLSLAAASTAKMDRLCRKIGLGANDHLLEIGTGWGGFAVHAAARYGARVTTTTISEAQYEYARRRVHDAGLEDRVRVLHHDYRQLDGVFDKLVSIEMIEAIGWRQQDTFFSTCARLLRPDGVMALQAIVIDDRSYERATTHQDFIKALIFPGGFLPSIESMIRSATASSDLRVVDLEDIGRHYAETLARWRANLAAHADAVAALGLGERFRRLWHMYLCYCEGAFLERHVSDVQLVLARGQWRASLRANARA